MLNELLGKTAAFCESDDAGDVLFGFRRIYDQVRTELLDTRVISVSQYRTVLVDVELATALGAGDLFLQHSGATRHLGKQSKADRRREVGKWLRMLVLTAEPVRLGADNLEMPEARHFFLLAS